MLLMKMLFFSLLAHAQSPEITSICAPNAATDEMDSGVRVEQVCFLKNENLKEVWQTKCTLSNGEVQMFFMLEPTYDQAASLQVNRATLKSVIYAIASGHNIITGHIQFYYPLNEQPPHAEGTLPNGLRFYLLNAGAPGLKAP